MFQNTLYIPTPLPKVCLVCQSTELFVECEGCYFYLCKQCLFANFQPHYLDRLYNFSELGYLAMCEQCGKRVCKFGLFDSLPGEMPSLSERGMCLDQATSKGQFCDACKAVFCSDLCWKSHHKAACASCQQAICTRSPERVLHQLLNGEQDPPLACVSCELCFCSSECKSHHLTAMKH